jgi:hypothetical protein
MEGLIMDEVKQLGDSICPPELGKGCANRVEMDNAFTVAATNVIWWLMASESMLQIQNKIIQGENGCWFFFFFFSTIFRHALNQTRRFQRTIQNSRS